MSAAAGTMLQVVAGTFNVVKAGRFYGRYWGAFETVKNLHFEACCECFKHVRSAQIYEETRSPRYAGNGGANIAFTTSMSTVQ